MPIATLTSAFASLKEAIGVLKTFNQLKTDTEVANKTIELNCIISSVQNDLFETQAIYATAIGRIQDLESKLMAMESWSTEKQRYRLHQLAIGSFTYRLQPTEQGSEPIHDLCAHCYQSGIKSILQFGGYERGFHKYSCQCCNTFVLGAKTQASGTVVSYPEPNW